MVQGTDVFVIGGGPAGLAAAIAARKKGFRVTVADGAQPPIDKACGEGLMPDALAVLRELGVEMRGSEGYAIRGVRFLGKISEAAASFPRGQGIGMKRTVLHQKLVEQAEACGVSLLWKTPVAGICREGVTLRSGIVPATWIVGADGIRSRVRRWGRLEAPAKCECRYAFRRHYQLKPWSDFCEVYWGDRGQAYVTPVGEDEVCVVLISRKPGMRFASIATEFPRLARRLQPAEHGGTERGAITVTQTLRRVHRERVALIGDASGTVDAITGEGLFLSFHQAKALADALEAGDLRRYEAAHRVLARRPAFMSNVMLLLDGRTTLRERVVRALGSDPALFSRLLAIHVGAKAPAHLAFAGARLGWRFAAA